MNIVVNIPDYCVSYHLKTPMPHAAFATRCAQQVAVPNRNKPASAKKQSVTPHLKTTQALNGISLTNRSKNRCDTCSKNGSTRRTCRVPRCIVTLPTVTGSSCSNKYRLIYQVIKQRLVVL